MCALAVVAVGVVMVVIGSGNDAAVELLSSHHGTQIRTALEAAKGIETKTARQDSERLSEYGVSVGGRWGRFVFCTRGGIRYTRPAPTGLEPHLHSLHLGVNHADPCI